MSRLIKVILSIVIIVVYLCLIYAALGALLYLVASWVMCIVISVVISGLSYAAFKGVNWIWKDDEEEVSDGVDDQHKKDETYRKVFLTLWLLELFSVVFFGTWVLIMAYFSPWFLFVALFGICYSFYKSVRWIWRTDQ